MANKIELKRYQINYIENGKSYVLYLFSHKEMMDWVCQAISSGIKIDNIFAEGEEYQFNEEELKQVKWNTYSS